MFQKWYSTELIIDTLRKSKKKKPYETRHSALLNIWQNKEQATCKRSLNAHAL